MLVTVVPRRGAGRHARVAQHHHVRVAVRGDHTQAQQLPVLALPLDCGGLAGVQLEVDIPGALQSAKDRVRVLNLTLSHLTVDSC